MRVGKLNLIGKTFPVVYSAWVQQQLENEGVSDPSDMLVNRERLFHNFIHLLSLMMRGGYEYSALIGENAPEPPDEEKLSIVIGLDDTERIMNDILLPVLTGERNVRSEEPEDEKNAAPAPETDP